ncbi:hypothetical protein HQ586_07125 [Candidatus Bathyarchaeota archaeon]|nr:hypothetical protein [Candidatus Bathyarchaeota archaeon]
MGSDRDMCFGGRSSTVTPIIIGILIILAGLIELFGGAYAWLNWDTLWPYLLILLGLLIAGNSLYQR